MVDGHRVKETVRTQLRRRGIEVGNYRHTIAARRQKMLSAYGIRTLVDVGANVGQYALEARRGGYGGDIVSVEPLGAAFQQLEATAAGDAAWAVRRTAVGGAKGTLTMHVSERSIFSSPLRILDEAVSASRGARPVATEEAPMTTLDELCTDLRGPLCVKIDVQGFEGHVLDGAPATLATVAWWRWS